MTWDKRVLPVPWVGASIRWSGVGPSIIGRAKGSRRAAKAFALLGPSANGKSPRRWSSKRSLAQLISMRLGRSDTGPMISLGLCRY
jgi:hypothetical protein